MRRFTAIVIMAVFIAMLVPSFASAAQWAGTHTGTSPSAWSHSTWWTYYYPTDILDNVKFTRVDSRFTMSGTGTKQFKVGISGNVLYDDFTWWVSPTSKLYSYNWYCTPNKTVLMTRDRERQYVYYNGAFKDGFYLVWP